MSESAVIEKEASARRADRILVVENEYVEERSLRKQLTALGYQVFGSIPSAYEVIQQAKETRPDLVLMDFNLEGPMDSVEAAATIHTRFRLPVIYLTAYPNPPILEQAKFLQPFGYIFKPIVDRELRAVIETALQKHRNDHRLQEREKLIGDIDKSEIIIGVTEPDSAVGKEFADAGLKALGVNAACAEAVRRINAELKIKE